MTPFARQNENDTAVGRQVSSVLVSGASFAGLASAWWMHKLGYSVTVVEIASGIRKGGTPVNIREGVIEVVRRMNMLDRIIAASLPPRSVTFLDAHGSPLLPAPGQAPQEPEEEYEIERDELLDILFNELQDKVKFVFNDRIVGLEQFREHVAVTFASGTKQAFSLLLGCDGTHSAVRKMSFGAESAFLHFLENYFSLTIVDTLLLEENTSQMFSVPGRTVMLNTYHGKTDIAFCFFSDREIAYDRRQQEAQKRLIREHFQGQAWRTDELLDQMTQSDNFYFDQLCQVRMESWTNGRVALVGDAGYCPSPAAGMGGSMAILGAAALADALQQHPEDLGTAFRVYEESLRPTVERIQADAVEVGLKRFMPRSEEAIQERNAQLGLVRSNSNPAAFNGNPH